MSTLSTTQVEQAVGVLCDAFHDYPVMRYVLGPSGDYDQRLRTLIGFFVAARTLRDELVLGIHDGGGTLAAAALVTLPGERPAPEALSVRRESVWRELGGAERSRYEAFGETCQQFALQRPHYHLNMIGVRRSAAGRGLGRRLLDTVHELSRRDSNSCGVTLTTETSNNVGLYTLFEYQLLGHARVSDELETWAFFRPDPTSG